jgi:hypothetical protein
VAIFLLAAKDALGLSNASGKSILTEYGKLSKGVGVVLLQPGKPEV